MLSTPVGFRLRLFACAIGVGLAPGAAFAGEAVDYLRDVKPILETRCAGCHGAIKQKAKLRLDAAQLVRAGGDSGPAVVPGKSDESLLIERVVETDVHLRMPPEGEGTALTADEVAKLRSWIDAGAKAPIESVPDDPKNHWAYQPPKRAPLPRGSSEPNPIDRFLSRVRTAKKVSANPPARKEVWLRRVHLDLVGLPPTREQIRSFLTDDRPDAFERVVDGLLASPAYGERWGRHWMDVWRYSDWYGLGEEPRYSHPHIWRWRDWIVESLNANKGYDRMVVEMLAGDEVAPDDPETLRATGYLVRNWDIFNRNAWLGNAVEHTSKAFLGITLQCARCHDHKFDPILQTDYYRFRAFFEPYQIRTDRVPGQPDTAKDGLPRVYDDFLDRPTYLFLRGDEERPDKSRLIAPAAPAVLARGEIKATPVRIPASARIPDKRGFVVAEDLAALDRAARDAEAALAKAKTAADAADKGLARAVEADRSKPNDAEAAANAVLARKAARDAQGAVAEAEAALALAKAKRDVFAKTVAVEKIEDDGGKTSAPKLWEAAAREAFQTQVAANLVQARFDAASAERSLGRVERALEGLVAASGDAAAIKKKAAEVVAVRTKKAEAADKLAKAEAESKKPITTAYKPRELKFPRAKVTYRDTPPNTPYPEVGTGRRLALANWIVSPENPLATRVAVNHVWARHFGEPLVASTYDFGLRSARPIHQDLLDWLAVDFVESGWDMKRLHRQIVLSAAYRMSSDGNDKNIKLDPDNLALWRANVKRMEGEVVRDSILHLAGRLDPKRGGADLPVAQAETGTRRSIYYRYTRDERIPMLTPFDFADVGECYRRAETVVPQQALALVNGAPVLNRADEIASGLRGESGEFVGAAFEAVLNRSPSDAERAEGIKGLTRLESVLAAESKAPASPRDRARSAFVHVLLNHNDFIMIR